MTTLILHGGQTSINSPNNDRFWAECTSKVHKASITITLIYWGVPEHKKPIKIQKDQNNILKQAGSKKINFIVPESAQEIKDRLDEIDVIYFSGGDFEPLEKYKEEVRALKDLVKDKVFLGSSLGTFIVCKYYMSSFEDQERGVLEGWGLLPVSVLCHWDMEGKKDYKLNSLKKVAPDLPILTLNETEFVEFHV